MTPEQRLKSMATSLKGLADSEKAAKQSAFEASCARGAQTACVQAAWPLEDDERAKARAIYQRACDAGAGLGRTRLGLTFRHGSKADLPRTLQLLKRGCDLNDGFGCFHLGDMAKLGVGGPRDPVASAGRSSLPTSAEGDLSSTPW